MIFFYDKVTGQIKGTIEGRTHTEDQLKIWVGDPNDVARLVVQWKPVRYYDQDGQVVNSLEEAWTCDFEPDHPQKQLLMDLEQGVIKLQDLHINPHSGKFVKGKS